VNKSEIHIEQKMAPFSAQIKIKDILAAIQKGKKGQFGENKNCCHRF
jgi:hypothetical protein